MSNQAEENEVVEAEAEELEQVEEVEQEEGEQPDTEQTETPEAGESDEVVVSIGDEPPPSEDEEERSSSVISDLRKRYRDIQKENRELKAAQAKAAQPEPVVRLGEKPTLESCDYDGDKFEAELTQWHERKRAADEAERGRREAAEADQRAWNAKLENYGKQKGALKVPDYEDAEAQAMEHLTGAQPQIIVAGADNPAEVIYALGKNPAKAKELGSIKDPVKFAFAVAKLETQVKVTTRSKTAPMPESRISGAGRVAGSGAADAKLSQLHEKAQKSGDYSAYYAAKREQAARKAA